jgi:hypothetical protein
VRRLTQEIIDEARSTRGATALLFLTDRCPVGCAHCSVDSRADSPKITDYALFEQVVEALCESGYWLLGISGGEAFVERRALGYATRRLTEAGKEISIVTSGVWAVSDQPPDWIRQVIRRCGSLVLSTDTFHADELPAETFIRAARAIAAEGTWLVAQVIDQGDGVSQAEAMLTRAFGPAWTDFAELNITRLLPHGRAAGLMQITATARGRDFGACRVARSPVIRYDGTISVCCNETVIMGGGPDALRRRGRNRAEISAALDGLRRHALLQVVADAGPGVLTLDPRLRDLGEPRYTSICELCWLISDRLGAAAADDPLLASLAALTNEDTR